MNHDVNIPFALYQFMDSGRTLTNLKYAPLY